MTLTDIGRRAELAGYLPAPLPMPPGPPYLSMMHMNGLAVIVTIDNRGGKDWVHVSASRADRIPSWDDLVFVRDTTIGRDAKAVIVIPPADQHVNIHKNCLHLWCCLGEDPLPDFRNEMGTL